MRWRTLINVRVCGLSMYSVCEPWFRFVGKCVNMVVRTLSVLGVVGVGFVGWLCICKCEPWCWDVESGVCLGGLWKCCKGCGCILGCEPWLGVRNMCWKQPLWVVWLYVCFVCWIGGCEAISFARNARAIAVFTTNRRNKGLISVDRRTSLLSYLQYPVSYQSRLQRIYCSQCPKGD